MAGQQGRNQPKRVQNQAAQYIQCKTSASLKASHSGILCYREIVKSKEILWHFLTILGIQTQNHAVKKSAAK